MKSFAMLLNPASKKGKIKKAKRRVARKVAKKRKIAKKVAKKVARKVAKRARRIKRTVAKRVTKKINKGARKMARRKKYNFSKAIGTKHRISVKKVKKGYQVGQSKLLVKSRGKILNPFNMGKVSNTLLEAGMIVAGMVGATIIPNKVLPAQYVDGKYAKPLAQVGTGIVMYYLVKKFLKKNQIAEQLLLGAVITVVKEMVDQYVMPMVNKTSGTAGLKINGLKLGNANAQAPLINPSNIRPDLNAPISTLTGVSQTRSVGTRRA